MKLFIEKSFYRSILTMVLFVIIFISAKSAHCNENKVVVYDGDCTALASVTVTTDKPAYEAGETVIGSIVVTNNTGSPGKANVTGEIYDEDGNLVYERSGSRIMAEGVNTFPLPELFETLYVPADARSSYTLEVLIESPELTGCEWKDSAVIDIVLYDFYFDSDGDTYGDVNASIHAAAPLPGYVFDNTDCNDADATIHPDAVDICDGIDNDCDGFIDYMCFGLIRVPEDMPTISAAMNYLMYGGTILVNDGVYYGSINFSSPNVKLVSVNGPEKTIIAGSGDSVVTFSGDGGPNTIIDGFTITNGYGYSGGGGIKCYSSSPTIRNCIITGNSAVIGQTPGLEGGGGGILVSNFSSPTITNSYITNNHYLSSDNYSGGGGICVTEDSTAVIRNCTISGNSSELSGGGIMVIFDSHAIIENCTIVKNTASSGSAFCFSHGGGADITNSIIWSDGTNPTNLFKICCGAALDFKATVIEPPVSFSGTYSFYPEFVDFPLNDFHLSENSPCIDMGATLPWIRDDIDGEARMQGIRMDIGSDEYSAP